MTRGFQGLHEALQKNESAERNLRLSLLTQPAEEPERGQATIVYDCLMEQIADFEATLSPAEEIGAYPAASHREMLMTLERVGYHNPYFIVFYGRDIRTKQRVQFIQHVTQMSVLFVALSKPYDQEKPRRIGVAAERTI